MVIQAIIGREDEKRKIRMGMYRTMMDQRTGTLHASIDVYGDPATVTKLLQRLIALTGYPVPYEGPT